MSILYSKTAVLHSYSENEFHVKTYDEEWVWFACAIQPVWTKDWIDWTAMFNTKKLYCDIKIDVWDKIVCEWITYIVNSVMLWNWIKRKYYKAFINESNWD